MNVTIPPWHLRDEYLIAFTSLPPLGIGYSILGSDFDEKAGKGVAIYRCPVGASLPVGVEVICKCGKYLKTRGVRKYVRCACVKENP